MGIDHSLSIEHPSVIINGSQYYYGQSPESGDYLVEHASNAKDYRWFKEKEDLVAFLVNLPESADRDRLLKLHPDWREVTSEQRDAYIAEDRLSLRAMADEKRQAGTAQSFIMDLNGDDGPHPPQHIQRHDARPPLQRVQEQLSDLKQQRMHGLSEAGKLRVIEGEIDWAGVTAEQKEAIFSREIDFRAITLEQFAFVYEDIRHEKLKPADPSVAQKLFDQARSQPEQRAIRPVTQRLVDAVLFDVLPNHTAIVDFGIDSQEHYEALYYPLRNGDVTPEQLDAALGNGKKLTELARSAKSNPHREIVFRTSWDAINPFSDHDDEKKAAPRPSPGDIAEGGGPESPGKNTGPENGHPRGGRK